jgi:DNA-binding NarL/FixJ family response regulator
MAQLECIRIVFAEMPPLLADIIRQAVAGEPDMAIVGECRDCSALREMLVAEGCEVVMVGTSDPDALALPRQLLDAAPRMKVLMLETRGSRAVMHELRPYRRSLGDMSAGRLVEAIRPRR